MTTDRLIFDTASQACMPGASGARSRQSGTCTNDRRADELVFRAGNGVLELSYRPGGGGDQPPDLPAPGLEPCCNSVLDPALSKVVVTVMPYPGMACGDRLVISWRGVDSDGQDHVHDIQRFVSAAQVGKPVIVVVRAARIAVLDGGSFEVYYTLCKDSLACPVESSRLQLLVGAARPELPKASANDTVGGRLDPERVPEGTSVAIRPYGRMAAGDRVFFNWKGNAPDGSFSDSLIIAEHAVGHELSFWVDPQYIAANLGTTVTFSYFVEHSGLATRHSLPAQLVIGARISGALPAPKVLEAEDGVLDPEDTIDGVTVVIEDANPQVDELVYLKVDGVYFNHRDDREISVDTAGESMVFIVPYRFWREHQGTGVRVSYSVERLDDLSEQSDVLEVRVTSSEPVPM